MNMGSYQEMCHCYHNYAQPICILHPLYIFSDTTSRVFTAILLIFDNLSYMFKLNFFRSEKFTSYFSKLLVYFIYNLLPGRTLYVIFQFVQ